MLDDLVDGGEGLAEGVAGVEVEGDGDGRELALVIDGEGFAGVLYVGEGAEGTGWPGRWWCELEPLPPPEEPPELVAAAVVVAPERGWCRRGAVLALEEVLAAEALLEVEVVVRAFEAVRSGEWSWWRWLLS